MTIASKPPPNPAADPANSAAPRPVITVTHADYGFSRTDFILRDLHFTINAGEFVAVVGPSGCGKTTLLNLLAGDMPPTNGTVSVSGVARRVFQQDGLFPWRTVSQNIALGFGRTSKSDAQAAQTQAALALIGLEGFGEYYPHQLSGGMKQRVQIARALSGQSDVLLMDEPFSALDYLTRLRLRREMARLLAENPRTVVLVTHDIEEAAQLADRILVLGERPASVRCELPVPLPRPREATDPSIAEVVRRVLAEMGL